MCLGGWSSVLLSEQEIIPTVPPTFIGHFFGVGSRAQFLLCSLCVLHFTSHSACMLHTIPLCYFHIFHSIPHKTSISFTPPPGYTYVPHFRQCSFTCQHFLEDTRGPYLCAQLGIIISEAVLYCRVLGIGNGKGAAPFPLNLDFFFFFFFFFFLGDFFFGSPQRKKSQ